MNTANFTPEELKLEIRSSEDAVRELELKLEGARQYVEGLKVAMMMYEASVKDAPRQLKAVPTSPIKATYN